MSLNDLLKDRPRIAWPTVVVALLTVPAWALSVWAGFTGLLPLWAAIVGATLAGYWAFTPLHEATHRSISPLPWFNDLVGWICGLTLLGPFSAFKVMHLTHHKFTNDPARDPDAWSGGGPIWTLPLRWLTQDWHYYWVAARLSSDLGWSFALQTWGTVTILWGAVAYGASQGVGVELLLLVVLPAKLSIALLAMTFDWLPHSPHEVESRSDRFRATSILIDPWLTPLFLCQNFHLVHHLYPAVPWYRYGAVWRLERARLLERGARVRSIIPAWRRAQPARR